MKCKQCENEIKENSRFCSFCGVRTDANAETHKGNPMIKDSIDALEIKDVNPKYLSKDKGYYIAGLVFFGLYVIQDIFRSLELILFQSASIPILKYFYICLNLALASIPILLSKYTRIKEDKIFLLVIGVMLIIIGIAESKISLPFGLGMLLYATPYVFYILLLKKTNSKTWREIFIGYLASTFYGINFVFASIGMVVESDYYGIAHLGILISYPVVNLIIALVYRFIRRSSNKS
jgi:hypothetical protein